VGEAGLIAPLSKAYQMVHLMQRSTGNPAYSIRSYCSIVAATQSAHC